MGMRHRPARERMPMPNTIHVPGPARAWISERLARLNRRPGRTPHEPVRRSLIGLLIIGAWVARSVKNNEEVRS